MNEEPLESPVSGREPMEEDVGQSTEKKSSRAENTSEAAPAQEEPLAPSDSLDTKGSPSSDPVQENPEGAKEDDKAASGEPPVDWFEPLEEDDDDANSVGRNDPEEESLAGESERSESVAGSEMRSHPDEGWVEWPLLGDGWKRKEVVRRSGSSIGQKDVYYMSPRGDRLRSRVELASVLEGLIDLSTFEYKTGKFYEGEAQPIRVRNRVKVLWIPCGQCVGCHNTVNCGQCANCKHGLQSPESRKRICRKRKCICPIRKIFLPTLIHNVLFTQHPSLKSSDTENFSVNVDVDDEEDMSTDDDDDWHKKRKRRSCGECKACLCRKDCGTCDFCIDKPKFGGSNKKRQKCRLRQCQRQAMRHLLPFQMGQGEFGPDGPALPGRPRPHYTYSRKSNFKKGKALQFGLDFTDNEDDDSNLQAVSFRCLWCSSLYFFCLASLAGRDGQRHVDEDDEEEDELPMVSVLLRIFLLAVRAATDNANPFVYLFSVCCSLQITQIFSLADNSAGSGVDIENQLMKLLQSLRSSVLPILWYAIMVEGPQLQLIQCSKQSNMTDTTVLIDPGFCYQVTVQKQPLLPTHPLYDKHPGRLSSVTEVVDLLLGLEKYMVCQGLPPKEPLCNKDPLMLERASTCDFLVKRKVSICTNCRALQGL
uniref:Methyl-CpG binding domain protein 1b n=1 Tax=Dicentrarchus labrax TaxID=13489 RepID=A0A8C4ISS4_DICLA